MARKDDWLLWGGIAIVGVSAMLFWPVMLREPEEGASVRQFMAVDIIDSSNYFALDADAHVPSDETRVDKPDLLDKLAASPVIF